jgi:hypothetical protein
MRLLSFAAVVLTLQVSAANLPITVTHAWAKATAPGSPVSGAYFDITATQAAKLVKVDSPAAGMVEFHEMKLEGGVMKMRPVDGLTLMPGQTITLKPVGFHVMLMDLKQPLKAGEKLPLVLTIEASGKRSELNVDADIRPISAAH